MDEMSLPIVVVGSLNMDLVVRTPRLPMPGETILGSDFRNFFGGKGANQAVAARRCGARVAMVGRVGTDAYGDAILQNLLREGIELSSLQRDPEAPTGVAVIMVDGRGNNLIVVAPGANARLSAADIAAVQSVFVAAGLLVLQLEVPLEAVHKAIELARQRNMRVLLNAAPATPLPPEWYPWIDFLIVNRGELALLSGEEQLEAGLSRLWGLGARSIIVTLGEQGALVKAGSRQSRLRAHAVTAVDTVGAGDAFVGARLAWQH